MKNRISELRRSTIFRLYLIYTLLFITTSFVMYVVIYKMVSNNLRENAEKDIDAEIYRRLGTKTSDNLSSSPSQYTYLIEKNGQKVDGNIDMMPPKTFHPSKQSEFVGPKRPKQSTKKSTLIDNKQVDLSKKTIEKAVAEKNIENSPSEVYEKDGVVIGKTITLDDARFFLGRNVRREKHQIENIMKAILIGLTSSIIIGLVGGLAFSNRSMRRTQVIRNTMKCIVAGNLDVRFVVHETNDDLEGFETNLNAMLDKINDLIQGMRQVTSNVAHDLRTPLTRLRGNLENMSLRGDEYSQIESQKAIGEVDDLLKTFNALLSISQLESGSMKHEFKTFDLGALIAEITDFYDVMADEKEQKIHIETIDKIKINGNRNLVSQAIINLLDNAIKYTPVGGEIIIRMEQSSPTMICFSIIDTGEGFDDTYAEELTKRFFRLEKHRSTKMGNGLGLSLVNAVIKGHEGEICFTNRLTTIGDRSGFIAKVTFPISSPQNKLHHA